MPQLSRQELRRYSRPLLLPEWGAEAQARVMQARVVVVGAGGLGCAALSSLAGAGVGSSGAGFIRICEGDHIDISNLHRQALYRTADIGRSKAAVAAAQVQAINPYVRVETFGWLDEAGALAALADVDVVLDATDNLQARYALSAAAQAAGLPCVWGAASGVSGLLTVFTGGAGLSDLFPNSSGPNGSGPNGSGAAVESCDEAGVLGPVPQLVGQMMALETLKLLGGVGEVLSGKLWTFDALSGRVRTLRYGASAENL